MKFLTFVINDVAKLAEVARASDKVVASPPPGIKLLAQYACLGIAFPGHPLNTALAVAVVEAESAEALAAAALPLMLAGATVWRVPVMELPVGGAGEVVKKMSV